MNLKNILLLLPLTTISCQSVKTSDFTYMMPYNIPARSELILSSTLNQEKILAMHNLSDQTISYQYHDEPSQTIAPKKQVRLKVNLTQKVIIRNSSDREVRLQTFVYHTSVETISKIRPID